MFGDNRNCPAEMAATIKRGEVIMALFIMSEMLATFRFSHEALKSFAPWRIALKGGEQFLPQLIGQFMQLGLPGLQLYDVCDSIKTSIIATANKIDHRSAGVKDPPKISIGKVRPIIYQIAG